MTGATDHLAVELVIQTAAALLTGRFAPREAVTILATQAPQARGAARSLVESEPDLCRSYAELIQTIAAELALVVVGADQARDQRAVIRELERVVTALSGEGRDQA